MAKQQQKRLRVVIVGGSVAGLTLAHSLVKAGIDFVVLESNSEIAPQVGASIGILPNGARILDQVGVWDDVYTEVEPLHTSFTWTEKGRLITTGNIPEILHERHGYPTAFLDRQVLLEKLYNHLGCNQHKVHVNKKATQVEYLSDKVIVHCHDGTSYEGDIVVGADGVRSTIRREMWRYMESISLNEETEKEKKAMTSEYSCVFGISTATPGLAPGTSHRTYADGFSFLNVIGKHGRVFWFLFIKLDRRYPASNIPRFRKEDIQDDVAPFMEKAITADVPFSAIYDKAIVTTRLSLEEASYRHWTKGRFACIGDSAHKMTPNMGQGGNSAIESAALLANYLVQLNNQKDFSQSAIESCLQAWETARQPRVNAICEGANKLTRTEALASPKDRSTALYLLPWMQRFLADKLSRGFIGAEKLDFLPDPPQSAKATIPFIQHYDRLSESIWKRALWTLPLLGCYKLGSAAMDSTLGHVLPFLRTVLEKGTWASSAGEVVDLTRPIYHVPFLDKMLRPMITCFLPSITGSDALSRAQMLSFMVDIGPVYVIWLLESSRRAHSWAEVVFPVMFGTAFQFLGIGKIAPLYYALDYLRAPLSKVILGMNRSIDKSVLTSLPIALLAGYYIPTLGCFFASGASTKQTYNAIWQLFPILIPLLQAPFRLSGFFKEPSSRSHNNESKAQTADSTTKTQHSGIAEIRKTYIPLAVLSGLTFIYSRFTAPAGSSVLDIFFPKTMGQSAPITSFSQGIARFLQYDEIFGLGSGLIWLGLRFRELRELGVSVNWWKLLGGLIGVGFIAGPGAAFTVGWGVREELLYRVC
ncbi:FAD/NAD(P)-binding domain-containing protein [Aspergillus steynii IBT 23096]|uniref:FAD/NAD(P)-binding domain-containing protein n=1 Tax=Aspergillus steynii IBT 23096 TaxID=1392250 RepID=A0A2I2FZW2_9EURO|nr:FAD/NAD(P)-binding domain-containing protein [Aspergillus steynii IBT 23096]PLB46161.1 FAD/NAD(P)-binding domain-containing protein [Aspergillus steynii IBT 23096]